MVEAANPYIAGNPVTGSEMFFGREDVFQFIRQTLIGRHRDNVIVIYGQQRTGKTSVLYQARSHLDIRYICIFIDLHSFALEGLGGFLWELANQIDRVLRRDYQIDLPYVSHIEFMTEPRRFFENEFLSSVWSAIGNRHILLMIDEAIRLQEQVQAGKLEPQVFEYMRHLMQHYEQMNFLFSLGSGLEEMEREYTFLFSVGLYKKISFLDQASALALITQPVQDYYQVTSIAQERILEITSGHAYYTQLLCHSLFNRWQRLHVSAIDIQDVDTVLDEVVERGLAVLKHIWGESTSGEKSIMAGMVTAMGEARHPVKISAIDSVWRSYDVLLPEGETANAIKSLIAREVIIGQEEYKFTIELQRLWIKKYRRIEWVKEEIRDAIREWSLQSNLSPQPRRKFLPPSLSRKELLFTSLVLLILVVTLMVSSFYFANLANKAGSPALSGSQVIGVIQEPSNDYIGISNGIYAFDTNRSDGDLKRLGSDKFKIGDTLGARAQWLQATGQDTNDAEALIYLEDLRVSSSSNYVTFIVGTALTGNDTEVGAGRDVLQGAYVAQKEYNDGAKLRGGKQIRLLIANSGSNPDYATVVAQQIVQAARQDHTIIGVLGWPDSARTVKVLAVLSKAHIPMVSPTSAADDLTGASSFFFRVIPSNKYQAVEGAKYAKQQLHAQRIALFLDPNDPYSSSLGNDFRQQFSADQIVDTEIYKIGQNQTLPTLLQNALAKNPDLIYFSGYSSDLATLLIDLPISQSNLQIMGGDALYQPNGYPSSARASLGHLYFTSFFYPDEWNILGFSAAQTPAFFSEYSSNFDPGGQHPNIYGLSRADSDVALAYDATTALLQGCQNALNAGKILITPDVLRQGLAQITGNQAIQGVSGQISFGKDSDPINKAIVILHVDQQGFIQMVGKKDVIGCFQTTTC